MPSCRRDRMGFAYAQPILVSHRVHRHGRSRSDGQPRPRYRRVIYPKVAIRRETAMVQAIRFAKTGGPEVLEWQEVEVGRPGEGQVRLRHTAVGLNYIDTYQRSGLYQMPLPSGLGSEAAGVVEEVGPGVTELKPGDRVAYAGGPPRAHSGGGGEPGGRPRQNAP